MGQSNVFVARIFANQTVEANGDITSNVIRINDYKPNSDKCTFQMHLAGASSTVTLTAEVSHDGVTFIAVTGATIIVSNQAVGDSMHAPTIPIALVPFVRIKAAETAGHAVTDLDVTMALR